MSEHALQNAIRNALCDEGLFFRANVGQAWTGSRIERLSGGRVLIHDARPFTTGLPAGFSDLFGIVPVVVTPDMLGQSVGIFAGIEIKSLRGRASEAQERFIAAVQQAGGRAGIARDVVGAIDIVKGKA